MENDCVAILNKSIEVWEYKYTHIFQNWDSWDNKELHEHLSTLNWWRTNAVKNTSSHETPAREKTNLFNIYASVNSSSAHPLPGLTPEN